MVMVHTQVYNARCFGPANVGRLHGVTFTIAAAFSFLIYPVVALTNDKLDGNFDDLQARGISLDLREMYSCSRKSAAQGGGACTPTLGD